MTPQSSPGENPEAPPAETPDSPDASDSALTTSTSDQVTEQDAATDATSPITNPLGAIPVATTSESAEAEAVTSQTPTPEAVTPEVTPDEPTLTGPDPAAAADPLAADPVAADPVAADPVVADPVVADPVVADPVAADPVAADPYADDPYGGDPLGLGPAAGGEPARESWRDLEPVSPPTAFSGFGSADHESPSDRDPSASKPAGSPPLVSAPESTAPEASAPEARAPQTTAPQASAPQASAPQASAPAPTYQPASEPAGPIDWANAAPADAPDGDSRAAGDVQGEFVPPTVGLPPAQVKGSSQDTLIPMIGSLFGLVAIAALLIVAFVLPASKSGPHNVPIGVSGSEPFKAQVRSVFAQGGANEFEIRSYASEASLRRAIENRAVYGGLNLGEQGVSLFIASAASVEVARALNSLGGGVQVVDVKSAPEKDPLSTALSAAGLPLAIVALLPALLLIRVYRNRPLAQLATAIVAAFGIGAAAAAMLTYWIGATQGANFWLLTVALAAGMLSASLLLLGLYAIGGRIGLGIGLAVLVFVSIPLAGFTSGPEWLPEPWGDIGRYLPAGAAATLLRNAAFFDGNAAGIPLAVLGAWALAGLLMLGLSEGLTPAEEPLEEEPPRPASDVLAV